MAYVLSPLPLVYDSPGSFFGAPDPITSLPFVFLLALGMSIIGVLSFQNRQRFWTVLRPSVARVICAILMAAATPLIILNGLPVPNGLAMANIQKPDAIMFGWSLTIPWYLVSCLIISGIVSRWWRLAGFVSIWCACYSAVVLIMGIWDFQM